ncbi:restriction endonuclease subunit S [Helicobacter kayseriensis]|uniref:restriction endonuclease subunit S n=1 Tax=Helicobacter kayseriensis TaxID=2905877 RepID=UPI001E48D221|nr:restriction endonuclease subunit S [Helicobacter kayseriensis]MCE3046537.1 restriction endonuclease subunit S [Helicobacter kayseriensis]MCE3048160.1 restriction endonuclease subunit S [Helicobacter kayseriensis]
MRTLKDIAHIQVGLTLSRTRATLTNLEKYPYRSVSINAFCENGITMLQGYENSYLASEQISSEHLTQEGDVLVRLRDPIRSIHISKAEEGLLISSLIAVIRPNPKIVLGKFLAFYLNSSLPQAFFQSKIKGTAIATIKLSDLKDLKIPLPSIERQKTMIEWMQESQKQISLFGQLIEQKQQFQHQIFKSLLSKE